MTDQAPKMQMAEARKRLLRRDVLLGLTMLVSGLAIATASYLQTGAAEHLLAQAGETAAPEKADPTQGQSRPTTPAPEPARPQETPDATPNSPPKSGAAPTPAQPPAALPPAPAEKTGEPIKPRT